MNPSTAMWINIVLTALSGAATAIVTNTSDNHVVAAATAAATILGALNTVFHAYSSAQPGPLSK